jgi:Putative DNA-binding domain
MHLDNTLDTDMDLYHKPLDQVTEQDLQGLVDQKTSESRTLDYKLCLPENPDELRYDASSFANAAGGILIYGIEERRNPNGEHTGEPEKIVPLTIAPDTAKQRIEQILQANIDPRLPVIKMVFVPVKAGGSVCLLRIPKSWLGLHLVKINNSYRFYSRNSSGRYVLDASEIKMGFETADQGYERLKRFRYERIGRIIANQGSIGLQEAPTLVLHILPISSAFSNDEWDIVAVRDDRKFKPMRASNYTHDFNFDGVVKFSVGNDPHSYAQFFHNGSIESVTTAIGRDKMIASNLVERTVVDSAKDYVQFLRDIEVPEPLLIGVSLLHVKGHMWSLGGVNVWGRDPAVFKDATLVCPEVVIDSYEGDIRRSLRMALNRISNAADLPGSPSYDDTGNWIGG